MDSSAFINNSQVLHQVQPIRTDQKPKILYSQRPPLAKRVPTQQSQRSGLNLKQFEDYYMKNLQHITKRLSDQNQSSIIEQKENLSFTQEDQDARIDERRQSKTRIQSAKPFKDQYNSTGKSNTSNNNNIRSSSQSNRQYEERPSQMKNLIAISIKSYEKPVRDLQSAKASHSQLARAGLQFFRRVDSAEPRRCESKKSIRDDYITSQKTKQNVIPTKHINISTSDVNNSFIEQQSSDGSLLKQKNLSHNGSQARLGKQHDLKRQNSEITKPSTAKLENNQSERLRRLNSIQQNVPLPYISAQSWSIYDINQKKFLNGKKENYKREVASITKMMTFYTCLKIMEKFSIDPATTIVNVSRTASRTNGTSACLREGDQLSVDQLFYGLMLPSGNDAAYCLAEYFGQYLNDNKYKDQSVQSFQFQWSIVRYFLKEMNLNAFKLRMFQSQFDSPHGLANKHNYSTASDICLLATKCMEVEKFREVVNTIEYKTSAMSSSNGKKQTKYVWENTNKLLGQVDGFIGCKTGITNPAGPCFCGGYEKDDHKYIVVVLCSKSMEARWVEVPKMVDWAIKKKRITNEYNNSNKGGSKDGDKSRIVRII